MPSTANWGLLRVARHRSGLTQAEAAERLDITQVNLSRLENGVTVLNHGLLAKASALFGLPPSFFMQPDQVFGAPVSVHPLWRKKHDVTARELDGIVAEMNIRAMHLRRLLQAVDFQPRFDIPRLDTDEYEGDIERIAAVVRSHWLTPTGPFIGLTEAVERAGAVVIHSPMGGSAVSGVTISAPGLPPMIALNSDQPADRMRFTLAHELGHIVMHRFPGRDMEREANAFASALLMPAAEIRAALSGRVDLRRLAALKPEWRVSMQGLLYRAQSLGVVGKAEAGWIWRQFSSMRMKMREPVELDFPIEEPGVVERMIGVHREAMSLTFTELSALLHATGPLLTELYGIRADAAPPATRLRVVK